MQSRGRVEVVHNRGNSDAARSSQANLAPYYPRCALRGATPADNHIDRQPSLPTPALQVRPVIHRPTGVLIPPSPSGRNPSAPVGR